MLMFFVSLKTWYRRCHTHTHNLSWYHWRVSYHVELVSSQRKDGSKWWRCYSYKAIHLDKYHLTHHVAWRKLKPRRTVVLLVETVVTTTIALNGIWCIDVFLHWRITSQSQPANLIFDLVFYDSLLCSYKLLLFWGFLKVIQAWSLRSHLFKPAEDMSVEHPCGKTVSYHRTLCLDSQGLELRLRKLW